MHNHKQALGLKGERFALAFLRQRGYKIITRNFRCRFGEIDIVARQRNAMVFIEVKTRASWAFGLPQEAINKKKLKHLWLVAKYYIKIFADPEGEFRFDMIAISWGNKPKVRLIKDII